jgi:hypothetical protein
MDEPRLVSPIIMSIRALDKSEDIKSMLALIYGLYRSEGIPHTQESLDN